MVGRQGRVARRATCGCPGNDQVVSSRGLDARVSRLPLVVGGVAGAVFLADLRHRNSGLALLEHQENLASRKSVLPHQGLSVQGGPEALTLIACFGEGLTGAFSY